MHKLGFKLGRDVGSIRISRAIPKNGLIYLFRTRRRLLGGGGGAVLSKSTSFLPLLYISFRLIDCRASRNAFLGKG
jgi:hypothetical protein